MSYKKEIFELNKFIKNNYSKYNNSNYYEFYKFGYSALGPALYGFLEDIHIKANKKKLEHIYFFSRDGYLLKEAYDNYYYKDNKISSSYLYVSRKALLPSTLKRNYSINEIKEIFAIKNNVPIKNFLYRLTNNISNYTKYLNKYNISLDETITSEFYNDIKEELFDEIGKQKKILEQYLIQEKFNEYRNIGIMDLGWRGSIQFSLEKIIKNEPFKNNIYGFYMGLIDGYNKYNKEGMQADGYLFTPNNNIEDKYRILGSLGLVELMFSAPHGSVLGYKLKDGRIDPILDKLEHDKTQQEKINEIQQGALNFIRDFSYKHYKSNLEFDKKILFKNFINTISRPTLRQAKIFGDFTFNDFEENKLACPLGILKYIKNPNKFIIDFRKSNWKIGFMKRLFKIKFNYFYIYKKLKKITDN